MALLSVAGLFLAVSGYAVAKYPGSPAFAWIFCTSLGLVLALSVVQPRLYSFLFFAVFLLLGFWVKFLAIVGFDAPPSEPIGRFSNRPEEWDRALLVGAVGLGAAATVRLAHLVWARRPRPQQSIPADVPRWYVRWRLPIWIASLVLVVVVNLWNLDAVFYQIGVNPRVLLPARLNVLMAWLIVAGFAMWFALLVQWEWTVGRSHRLLPLLGPLVEALATLSTLSRSVPLLHSAPYGVAFIEGKMPIRSLKARAAFVPVSVMALLIVLAGVSVLRILIYPPRILPPLESSRPNATPVAEQRLSPRYLAFSLREVTGLFVGRWVGLEGVLAVSSHPGIGHELFVEAIREDPKSGVRSLYQAVAASPYQEIEGFTFLTLPGVIAVFYYSGSLVVVFLGIAVVTVLLMGTELVANRLIRNNPLFLAVVGSSMANVLVQTNFPYLTAVFFAEQWVAVSALAIAIRVGRRNRALAADRPM